jgi:hypothetical protein
MALVEISATISSGAEQTRAWNSSKTFNIGLPRTGTTSFANYTSTLGLKTLHSNHGQIQTLFPEALIRFETGVENRVDEFIRDNDAFGDLPWYDLAEPLMKRAPANWKFVATYRRDYAAWVESMESVVVHILERDRPDTIMFHSAARPLVAKWGWHHFVWRGLLTRNMSRNERDAKLLGYYHAHYKNLDKLARRFNTQVHRIELAEPATLTHFCYDVLRRSNCPEDVAHLNDRHVKRPSGRPSGTRGKPNRRVGNG